MDEYFKIDIYPDGFRCPVCNGTAFHPKATVLPSLLCQAPDPKGKDGIVSLWVARSECFTGACRGYIDWTFHPDYPNGYGNEFRAVVEWAKHPLGLERFKAFPRSKR